MSEEIANLVNNNIKEFILFYALVSIFFYFCIFLSDFHIMQYSKSSFRKKASTETSARFATFWQSIFRIRTF